MRFADTPRVCVDEELNIVLLRLVEYLGHTNSVLCGLAYDEVTHVFTLSGKFTDSQQLDRLAQAKHLSPQGLLEPFWKNIAMLVVRDLHSRPQIAQFLSDLLNMSVAEFLVLTQSHTLPYLILQNKKDFIQRIVQARGEGSTIVNTLMDDTNSPPIVAVLLTEQTTNDVVAAANTRLHELSECLKKTNLPELAGAYVIPVACELLKSAGDEDEKKRARVWQLHTA